MAPSVGTCADEGEASPWSRSWLTVITFCIFKSFYQAYILFVTEECYG